MLIHNFIKDLDKGFEFSKFAYDTKLGGAFVF